MEVHAVWRQTVNFPLSDGDAVEHSDRLLINPIGQRTVGLGASQLDLAPRCVHKRSALRSLRDVMFMMTVLLPLWLRLRVLILVCAGVHLLEMINQLADIVVEVLLSRDVDVKTRETEF